MTSTDSVRLANITSNVFGQRFPGRLGHLAATLIVGWLVACGGPGSGPVIETAQNPSGSVNARQWQQGDHLVLISFDGFRWDYLDRFDLPNFARIEAEGVRAEGMIPPFPSKTFTGHYTIATGLWAEHHGLTGNEFYDPERGETYSPGDRSKVEDGSWYYGEPIWVTAERQGMVSAAFFFVGSEADVQGVRPSYWYRYDGLISPERRVDQVLQWLAMPDASRPRMITLYFSDVDSAGHLHGPDSPELERAVRQVDNYLGRLLRGMDALPHANSVNILLTSDHGMAAYTADNIYPIDLADFDDVQAILNGPYGSVWVDSSDPTRHRQVRDAIDDQCPPEVGVYLRDDVPSRLHFSNSRRVGDIVIVPPVGQMVIPAGQLAAAGGYTHGWDPGHPEMHGIFVARGPRIRPGSRTGRIDQVDIYPLMAELLGLVPAAVDGDISTFEHALMPRKL